MPSKFNDHSSKNARIRIDYKDKKPNVTFSYPSKKHQRDFSMFPRICILWGVIWVIFIYTYSLTIELPTENIDMSNKTECGIYYDQLKAKMCERYSSTRVNLFYKDIKEGLNLRTLIIILLLILPPIIIYYPFKQKWEDYFPKHQGKMSNKKLVVFKPKDVRKDEKGYFVEIPVFNNIVLNYEATKNSEFSKYLNLFEIREHNFKYVVAKKLKGDKKKKEELNDYIWYARFSFSKKPTTGQLSVLFS